MDRITTVLLKSAHVIDAWRVIPRAIVAMYGFMIYKLFQWYTDIPTHEETSCDDALIRTLIESGMDMERAMEMACTVVDTVGGPTGSQTSFVTVIIGLSSAMFGFYVNSGGAWRKNGDFVMSDGTTGGEIPWRKSDDADKTSRDQRESRPE